MALLISLLSVPLSLRLVFTADLIAKVEEAARTLRGAVASEFCARGRRLVKRCFLRWCALPTIGCATNNELARTGNVVLGR